MCRSTLWGAGVLGPAAAAFSHDVLQFGSIQAAFLAHSPAAAHSGHLGFVSSPTRPGAAAAAPPLTMCPFAASRAVTPAMSPLACAGEMKAADSAPVGLPHSNHAAPRQKPSELPEEQRG